jgi:TRAP-type uncharacterized transport system fused permease subunit
MQTSLKAFSLSLVSFLIPFAFAFDQTLLAKGDLLWIAIGFSSLAAATALWAMALAGYFSGVLSWPVRIIAATLSIIMILSPTGSTMWAGALAASFLFGASLVVFNKQRITDLG